MGNKEECLKAIEDCAEEFIKIIKRDKLTSSYSRGRYDMCMFILEIIIQHRNKQKLEINDVGQEVLDGTQEIKEFQKYVTIKQLIKLEPAFKAGGIRSLIFNEKKNGFSSCIRRVGRKILIDLGEFKKFVDKGQDGLRSF